MRGDKISEEESFKLGPIGPFGVHPEAGSHCSSPISTFWKHPTEAYECTATAVQIYLKKRDRQMGNPF